MTGEIKTSKGHRKVNRTFLVIVGIIGVIFLGLHIWFVNNARSVLKQIVHNKSNGNLRLELSQLTFNFLSNDIKVRQAEISSTDTLASTSTYHVTFHKLTLRVRSFWPLLLKKQLLLDTIKLENPSIQVTQWRKDTSAVFARGDLSVPQEMGKLYNSMLDVLETFGIRRIFISNARLRLINKTRPENEPVAISNIYLNLIRTAGNGARRDSFINNEQTVDLVTTNQDIAMPGGRHRLTFKSFGLHLFQKRLELDSCTITAIATDSTRSSYKIFFKKLLLIGVDFDAMYTRNLIKADSVYCENPSFQIRLEQATNTAEKKERPDLQKIIRDLTDDMDLGFVGVKDAGINIEIAGKKSRSLFNSNKDNFELRGLKVNADSSSPVTVARFDMLVRDYRLYNEDSSTMYGFDSIRFINNKVALNNFIISTLSKNRFKVEKDVRVPYFELFGMDWYQLVFEENFKAREAILFNPVINYRKNFTTVKKKNGNFFTTLQTLDDLLTLDKINVINGKINMQLGASSFNLQDANLSLYSNQLLQSKSREGLRRAIERFSFSSGIIKVKDLTAHLQNVRYTGDNLARADKVVIKSGKNRLNASLENVLIDNMLLDRQAENVIIDGLQWSNGNLDIHLPGNENPSSRQFILVKNLAFTDTKISVTGKPDKLNAFIRSFSSSSVVKKNKSLEINDAKLSGQNLSFQNGPVMVKASNFNIRDRQLSSIASLNFSKVDEDTLTVTMPALDFITDINGLLSGTFILSGVRALNPVVYLSKWSQSAKESGNSSRIQIADALAIQPDISIAIQANDSVTRFNLPASPGSRLNISGIDLNRQSLEIKNVSLQSNSAFITKGDGEILGVEDGKVDLQLSNFNINKNNGQPTWNTVINELHLQNPKSLNMIGGKSRLTLASGSMGNFKISSEYKNIEQILKNNISSWIRTGNGQFIDSNVTFRWYNAEYNSEKKILGLDSFSYRPTRSLDSVLARAKYQADYITFNSGAVKLTSFNLENFKRDGGLIAKDITIEKPYITIYRDKLPPFQHGKIKPLPVEMFRKILFPVSVDNVFINDGNLTYTERNEKTRAEGTILISRINGGLSNIRNGSGDNDTLSLALNGYFMDSALINLRVKESYYDSLNGFLMTVKLTPTSLTFLNPMLEPMANVKIRTGVIDSFQMRAIANEYIGFGNMNMYYHDLNIMVVKGDSARTTLLTRFASFLVNSFVIRKNNKGKASLVYYERQRDRSFFNYIVKMAFSGIATSVGIKKDKKYRKNYLQGLKDRNLSQAIFE